MCVNIFCILDEDNFIKSVTENWVLQKRLWPALASLHPLLSSDFLSARNLFLWKTKKISSSRGERISFAEEMDFFCERALSLAVPVSPAWRLHQNHSLIEIPEKGKSYFQPNLGFTCNANWILNENSWQ